jgi:hypothetical protein
VWQDERARGLVHVVEAKLGTLVKSERVRIESDLEARWRRSRLAPRYPRVAFDVCDARLLRDV